MSERPQVFISCGQRTDEEKELGNNIASLVGKYGYDAYFAEEVTNLNALTTSIFKALYSSSAFITVMHDRGKVSHSTRGQYLGKRASVWIEQEIAIAAFISHCLDKKIEVAAFFQKGITEEGVREYLHLNPIEFQSNNEVLNHLENRVRKWKLSAESTGSQQSIESWFSDCASRWTEFINPNNVGPTSLATRFLHGYWSIAYKILDLGSSLTLEKMHDAICVAQGHGLADSFWPVPGKSEHYPMSVDTWECWMGKEDRPAAHSIFWRARTDCSLFLRSGYHEDLPERSAQFPSGSAFFILTPTWLIGNSLQHASRLAKAIGANEHRVKLMAKWSGVGNRQLGDYGPTYLSTYLSIEKCIARLNEIPIVLPPVLVEDIDSNLHQILREPIKNVCAAFSYFPKDDLVEQLASVNPQKA